MKKTKLKKDRQSAPKRCGWSGCHEGGVDLSRWLIASSSSIQITAA